MKERASPAAEKRVVCRICRMPLMAAAAIVFINAISCRTPDHRKGEAEPPKKETEEAAVEPQTNDPGLDQLQDRLRAIRTDAVDHSAPPTAPARDERKRENIEAESTRFGEGTDRPRTQAGAPAGVPQEEQAKRPDSRMQFLQQQWKQAENSKTTAKDLERAHAPRDPAEVQRTYKREAEIIYGTPAPQYNRRPTQRGWTNSWLPRPR